jgi:cytochrome c553
VLHLFGKFPLLPAETIDHAPRERGAPAAQPTVEFGRYVAQSCSGCHTATFAGRSPIAPGTPPVANLTVLKSWTQADFFRALREGRRPDGSAIDPFMPWQMTARMTDTELSALYLFLQSLPETAPAG